MTPRLALAAIGLGLAVGAFAYVQNAERAKDRLDDATDHIETRKEIDDEISCRNDLPWFDRVHECTE